MDRSNDITITAKKKKMDFQFVYYCLQVGVEQKKRKNLRRKYRVGIFAQLQHHKFVYSTSDVLKERRISLSLSRQRLTSAG